jgi:hypothetical protein
MGQFMILRITLEALLDGEERAMVKRVSSAGVTT